MAKLNWSMSLNREKSGLAKEKKDKQQEQIEADIRSFEERGGKIDSLASSEKESLYQPVNLYEQRLLKICKD